MVAAALCGRVRALPEGPAVFPSIERPDRRRGPLDRRRERLGAPSGAKNSPFSPKFASARPLASYHGASRVPRWSSVSKRRARMTAERY